MAQCKSSSRPRRRVGGAPLAAPRLPRQASRRAKPLLWPPPSPLRPRRSRAPALARTLRTSPPGREQASVAALVGFRTSCTCRRGLSGRRPGTRRAQRLAEVLRRSSPDARRAFAQARALFEQRSSFNPFQLLSSMGRPRLSSFYFAPLSLSLPAVQLRRRQCRHDRHLLGGNVQVLTPLPFA